MKHFFLRALPLLALVLGLVVHASAKEPATPAPADPVSVPAGDVLAELEEAASLRFPVQPDFLSVRTRFASCVSCTSHSQCASVCGGFGACIADFGLDCGLDREATYCFCF